MKQVRRSARSRFKKPLITDPLRGAQTTPRIRTESCKKGGPLTRDDSKASYAVIRHNIRTYESGGVVEVIKGRQKAETTMRQFENGQSSDDRHAGWRYFLEKTGLKAGMDPAKATHLRETDLEIRESKAPQK